jgi:uncharacterized Tic20 family protein
MMEIILGYVIIYLFIAFIFAVIHFAALEIAETRINVAKMIFWPVTTVYYIIYSVLWLLFSFVLLLKDLFSKIITLMKNFNNELWKRTN